MQQHRRRFCLSVLALAFALAGAPRAAPATPLAGPLAELQLQLATVALHAPGRVGIEVEDLATGMTSGINASVGLPAASTIKIPVMVETFEQLEAGDLQLDRIVHLQASDRDYGWGALADAPTGTARSVKQLLWAMITQSDNTATNMLIRLIGRQNVNDTMASLGLHRTTLGDYIRSETNSIRYALRTSPQDMTTLLDLIARDKLVDEWSSREMLAILAGQTHNGLLPAPLPKNLKIAHKTGSLHDTLNDVGIVYRGDEPYVIAVMTTQLPDLDLGRAFIHKVSRIAYDSLSRVAAWREDRGIAGFVTGVAPATTAVPPISPDERMWNAGPPLPAPSTAPLDPATGAGGDTDPG